LTQLFQALDTAYFVPGRAIVLCEFCLDHGLYIEFTGPTILKHGLKDITSRSVFQEYAKSGLFKMMVRRKGIGKTHSIHDYKAGTISEAPLLIKPLRIKPPGFIKNLFVDPNDHSIGGRLDKRYYLNSRLSERDPA
jgi:hypothetical protein